MNNPTPQAPQIWYRLSRYAVRIEAVKIIGVSPHSVTTLESFFGGRPRPRRTTARADYFPTFKEAKAALVGRRQEIYDQSIQTMTDAKNSLIEAVSLKPAGASQ